MKVLWGALVSRGLVGRAWSAGGLVSGVLASWPLGDLMQGFVLGASLLPSVVEMSHVTPEGYWEKEVSRCVESGPVTQT